MSQGRNNEIILRFDLEVFQEKMCEREEGDRKVGERKRWRGRQSLNKRDRQTDLLTDRLKIREGEDKTAS